MAETNEQRFADRYEMHRSAVWLYCRRRVGVDRADDAMSDVFLTVWRRIAEAPPTADALPWLYRVSYLTVSNHWRSAGRRKRLQSKVSNLPVAPSDTLVDQIVVREEVREVVDLLRKLKPSDAEVLMLAAWELLGTAEIASVLNVSVDAAKQRLSRARRRLTELHNKESNPRNEQNPPLLGKEVSGEH